MSTGTANHHLSYHFPLKHRYLTISRIQSGYSQNFASSIGVTRLLARLSRLAAVPLRAVSAVPPEPNMAMSERNFSPIWRLISRKQVRFVRLNGDGPSP